jgi:hypothetical protein
MGKLFSNWGQKGSRHPQIPMDNDKAQKTCKGAGQYRINVNQAVKLKRQSVFFKDKSSIRLKNLRGEKF